MFKIIQSHRTESLVQELLGAYKAKDQPIFAEFIVIVPSMVIGDWLDKSIASQAGISTLVTTKFWGQYQWTLMQKVLAEHNTWLDSGGHDYDIKQEKITVPEVAVLTGAVMQWRLFGYFTYYQQQILGDEKHPLYPLLSALLDEQADQSQQDSRLWSLATDFSRVFGRYLNHRDNWLHKWSKNEKIDAKALIEEKDQLTQLFDEFAGLTPEWLIAHFVELEAAQRHLWHLLFASVFEHRASIESRFWQIMKAARESNHTDSVNSAKPSKTRFETGVNLKKILPKQLHIFTIQQLPQNELDFLQKLSTYMDITLLHYNPSQLFWADIVDKQWLERQQVINPKSVFLRDYGHTLLSRLGKQSRETFAMLASLDASENKDNFKLDWQNKFKANNPKYSVAKDQPLSLLAQLQQDVLMLDESATQQSALGRLGTALSSQLVDDNNNDNDNSLSDTTEDTNNNKNSLSNSNGNETAPTDSHSQEWYDETTLKNKRFESTRQWPLSQYDNSLSIHSCHSLQRQLEVLRGMIGRWLNETNADGSSRHVSDIVVMLPDVERHHELISSVFVNGRGQDGLTLPAKVTGVVDKSIRQLWEAISGFYKLLGSETARFESATVLDWLMLPPLYESLGLTHEQMSRACDLLDQAGFIRGFDEAHLQQTLDSEDYDYRYSFAHALDKIALGLIMPEVGISDCLYPEHWLEGALAEKTIPISAISLDDATIVEALCRIHAGLNECRDDHHERYQAEEWLNRIEDNIIHLYFSELDQTRPMRAIYNAMNGFKSSLRANRQYQHYSRTGNDSNSEADNNLVQQELLGLGEQNANYQLNFDAVGQVESKLAKVSTLPLKLSFMLDSIENELKSQQVSAEPTGVITFGRFGALRNVPFGLVVMLNMDLSEFPNRDRDNRYDLMKAGLAKRGDRFSEDDDNGAFLDALLCARSACWIFYNGQRLTDIHEHLPANPVSELMQFLQGEVDWQWAPLMHEQSKYEPSQPTMNEIEAENTSSNLTAQMQRYLPKLIEQWLVTHHPALPFASEVFIDGSAKSDKQRDDSAGDNSAGDNSNGQAKSVISLLDQAMQKEKLNQKRSHAPARIWQAVFTRLQEQESRANQKTLVLETVIENKKVTLPTSAQHLAIANFIQANTINASSKSSNDSMIDMGLALPLSLAHVDVQQLYYQVRHPAKNFLREQQVHVIMSLEQAEPQEPLSLSGLGAYSVNEKLLKQWQFVKEDSNSEKSSALDHLIYDPVMPAGVARQSTLHYQQLQMTQKCADFAQQLTALGVDTSEAATSSSSTQPALTIRALLTPCTEKMVTANALGFNTQGILQIKGSVPSDIEADIWLNILPNSARSEHLLRFWLAHIFWQVARGTTAEQAGNNEGRSIWRFNKGSSERKELKGVDTFELPAIDYETALAELLKWMKVSQIAAITPLVVMPVYALNYLDKVLEAQNKETEYSLVRKDFENWMSLGYGNDIVFETCSKHELWQYILQDHDAFKSLSDALPILSKPLFGLMHQSLVAM